MCTEAMEERPEWLKPHERGGKLKGSLFRIAWSSFSASNELRKCSAIYFLLQFAELKIGGGPKTGCPKTIDFPIQRAMPILNPKPKKHTFYMDGYGWKGTAHPMMQCSKQGLTTENVKSPRSTVALDLGSAAM